MIKMLINEEEVVSNKEFTINEEMLSTSSTILNNCYPKSWEDTKDYVNNFYYPLDYSKFKLEEGDFLHGNTQFAELNASGINPSFETNVEKEFKSIEIDGKSYQATSTDPVSPSPDNPSEIENVKGKNLWDNSNYETNTSSGVEIKNNGFKFVRGEQTGGKYIAKKINVVKGNTYTFSAISSSFGTNSFYICIYRTKVYGTLVKSTIANFLTYTATETEELYFTFIIGSVITEVEASNIQLEVGTVATDYLPYDTIQIKNVGKNLVNPNGVSKIESDLTFTNNGNGIFTVSGTSTTNRSFRLSTQQIELNANQPYTQSVITIAGTKIGEVVVSVKNRSNKITYNYIAGNQTITPTENLITNTYTYYIAAGKTVNWTFKVQLEKGSTSTDYETYQENILNLDLQGNELCSLPNNIKDELVIENGRAKIIKRVGKVILNGSERWGQNANQKLDNTSYYYTYALDDLAKKNSQIGNLRSNYFINQKTYNIDNEGISLSAAIPFLRLRINTSTVSTPEELLTWLAAHNTIVYYELATPTEIDLGEVGNLSTFKGANNVSLNANMETNMNLVYYYKNYDLKFCGLVKNSGDISLNPRYPKYCSLQILDFKTLLSEGETLDFVINNKTIIQAIRMVISAISDYGFVEGNINIFNEDEEIGAYSTLNKTAYDVFQYLADISGSRWTTRLVDEDTIAIDFYDTTLMPKGKNIEYNSKYWEDNKIVDLTFNFGTRDYRNKQIILSDEVYADIDYSEEVITDGYTTTFNLSSNIGSIYSISINGQEATFTTQINKKIGVIADFYYEVGKSKIESDDLLTSGKVIKVTYIPLVKGRQIVYNNDEIARVTNQIGRRGTISRYESRNDVLSSSELNSIGQTYIKYKGSAEIILNLKVEDNDIYNVGDVVYFDAPIQNLAKDYMIKRKSIDVINVNDLQKIFYTYELTSSFNSERDINYFDNQRNKATGNISEGDTIDRNIDIEDTANIIFYGLEINEIQVEGDNTLNSVLNSPFIN
jgi:hypothetical protein